MFRRGKEGTVGEMADRQSILSVEEVGRLTEEYGIYHRAIGAERPTERVRTPPKGWVRIYVDYFKEGFCIPVSTFLVKVLKYYKIHLSQLMPNAVSHIIGFEVLCWSKGRTCAVGLFRYFFLLKLPQEWYNYSLRVNRPKLLVGF